MTKLLVSRGIKIRDEDLAYARAACPEKISNFLTQASRNAHQERDGIAPSNKRMYNFFPCEQAETQFSAVVNYRA